MEKFVYEHRPHFYGLIAAACFVFLRDSSLAMFSGVILAFCGAYISRIRYLYRRRFH